MKATIDNIPDTITVKNTEHEFILCNKAAMDHYKVYNAVQKNTKCYEYRGRSSVCPDCLISDVMISNQPARKEIYFECSKNWLDIRAYPILDNSNHVIKVVEHIRDITAQKETEMQLQRSYSILRAQLEASPDGILILDKNNQILAYNSKFKEVWNISKSISEMNADECEFDFIYHGDLNGNVHKSKVGELLHYFPHELSNQKIQLKDGTILNVFSKPILSTQIEAFGRVWYFRDITEREKMYEALRKSAEENEKLLLEAKKFDELKSEFFTNISHEFRTPINVLLGILQLLNMLKIEIYDNQLREKLRRYFSIMKQNCYRLLKLTNNLIDMSKLDTGFFEMNFQNQNIVQIVEEITLSVAAYIENKGIELIFDTDVEEKLIAVDVDKIERIILNLLSNAVKFTKENGMIQVNIEDKGDNIEISVKDTGIGIPAEKLDIIFERFRQVNSSLSRENEGSGIGLSLTKNLVELHGGSIRVNSKQGEGSEFIVVLPCRIVSDEMKKPVFYTRQSHVERIHLEFSDIYSL